MGERGPLRTPMNANGAVITAESRDDKGRFIIGNPGGPGNPAAAIARIVRRAMEDATDPITIQGIWRKAQSLALQGNERMIIYVIDRIVGKPKEHVEINGALDTDVLRERLTEFLRERGA